MSDTHSVRQGLLAFFIIACCCSMLVYLTYLLTGDRIASNRQLAAMRVVEDLMPLPHDNNLLDDRLDVPELATSVYRASRDGRSTGLVFMPLSANGYNDRIVFAMGVSYDGSITGVRIIEQGETQGLGDGIHQNVSNWIFGFDNRSLVGMQETEWALTSDGGDFDQLSGATISPRAVINAVKDTLEYYEKNREALYHRP